MTFSSICRISPESYELFAPALVKSCVAPLWKRWFFRGVHGVEEVNVVFPVSLLWWMDRKLLWWPVKVFTGSMTLLHVIIRTLAYFVFLYFSQLCFCPLQKLALGTLMIHRCYRKSFGPSVFQYYLILFWLTPTVSKSGSLHILWYLLLKASHDSKFFCFFF